MEGKAATDSVLEQLVLGVFLSAGCFYIAYFLSKSHSSCVFAATEKVQIRDRDSGHGSIHCSISRGLRRLF